ncbi:MAG: tryptophan synthase subunit beta [Deltaproteobacteria bacterium]|jgi:tryptophan synthase beta chain|nr:tryptophan synthase subunit beta [Deltaproteobacteria bacterium]
MKKGYFGDFGGQYVPELLMPPLLELEAAMQGFMREDSFKNELNTLLHSYAGRETPLTFCPTLSARLGFNLWLKREDLLHTGAHKVNNTLGQALLAKYMGKSALVAETGAGQHGVATAAAAARLGLACTVFMGAEDVERQAPNVQRMRLLGAKVCPVESGTKTLKDAINEALRFWIAEQRTTHYCFGTAAGPHPFPTLVRDLQSVIGQETIRQSREIFGRLPDVVVACVGGGSNAIGMFNPFTRLHADKTAEKNAAKVRLVGVEAGGTGEPGCYSSAPINLGSPGVLHGQNTMLLQDKDGQILPSHSVSAGLDYPGVGPEHVYLHQSGEVEYKVVIDSRALAAFAELCRSEGIIPALESSHALAWVLDNAAQLPKGGQVVVNLSGRGDKDMEIIRKYMPEFCGVKPTDSKENK